MRDMKEHFNNLGFEINGILHLSGRQALECIEAGALLVDVREDYEIGIKDFGITGKVECPVSNFENFMHTLPADRPLIIADCVGLHSKECVLKLLEKGFSKVANLVGGVAAWERDGLPMKNNAETMSGQCPCMIKSRKNN